MALSFPLNHEDYALKQLQQKLASIYFNGWTGEMFSNVTFILRLRKLYLSPRWSYRIWPYCALPYMMTTTSWLASESCLWMACRPATVTSHWGMRATSPCRCPPSSAKSSSRLTCQMALEVRTYTNNYKTWLLKSLFELQGVKNQNYSIFFLLLCFVLLLILMCSW